ncbi:MAG TPA: hypothetical protein VGL91_12340 [Acidobacteriota bacterium]|jgi:hypothetical protein
MRAVFRKILRRFERLLLPVLLFFAVSAAARAEHVLVFPQFPAGGDFVVSVTLVNANFNAPVTGTLLVFAQDGSPRSVAIDGQPTGSQFSVTIPAGGTVVLNTTPGGPITIGMAKFTSDFPAGGVVRFQFSGGQVGVLNSPAESFATLVINTAGGNNTGLAITNTGTASVNIRLLLVDANGQTIESIDPPELNPLNINGQIAKFATEFAFTQVANRSSGSIQIQVKGTGTFNALALLLRNGLLASTAIVPGAAGKFSPEQFHGSYTGKWTNTTFGSTGDATVNIGVIQSTQTVLFRLTLGGNVFGAPNAPPTMLFGTYTSSGFTASGDSPLFGPVTMSITADGTWTFTANNVPGGTIATFKLTGTAYPDRMTGNYAVTFKAGGGANGTLTLNHTGQ